MLLKMIGGAVICIVTWLMGRCYSETIKEKIKTVEKYVTFAQNFKSAVGFSGKNMFSFFEETDLCFCDFALKNKSKGIKTIFNEFETKEIEEKECLKILREALIFAENSSDIESIVCTLERAINDLGIYKKQLEEDLRGKIKTASPIGAMIGLFIAVLII